MRNLTLTLTLMMILTFALFSAPAPAGEPALAPEAPLVAVGKVGESENIEIRRYTGHVASSAQVNLVARVSGELQSINFAEGDIVEQGQVLYELDPVRYQATVKSCEAKIAESEARLQYSELSFSRAEELYRNKAGTKDLRDSSESEYNANHAALMNARAQLVTAQDDLKNTRILAPITGKIGLTNFTEGNYLTPASGTIATIVQLDPLRVNFSMSNRDFLSMFGTENELKKNSDIRLKLADDSIYPLRGTVEFVDNHANPRTDTLQIYVKFANPDNVLVPGSSVQVLLSRRDGSTRAAVAPSAVMHDSKSAYVYVVDGQNRVERRNVELGAGKGDVQLIKSGLQPGELVVVDGMHKTRPGSVVDLDFQG